MADRDINYELDAAARLFSSYCEYEWQSAELSNSDGGIWKLRALNASPQNSGKAYRICVELAVKVVVPESQFRHEVNHTVFVDFALRLMDDNVIAVQSGPHQGRFTFNLYGICDEYGRDTRAAKDGIKPIAAHFITQLSGAATKESTRQANLLRARK